MSFQDAVARDNRKVFLFPGKKEFAGVRCIAGKPVDCDLWEAKPATILDDGSQSYAEYDLMAVYADLPPLRVGENIVIDDQIWGILSFRVDGGMAVVHIARRS